MIWLAILGAPIVLASWFAIFVRWTLGVKMLLVYMPFAGAITLWLTPNPAPLLFKDFLFVIPIYLALVLLHLRDLRHAPIPPAVTGLIVALAAMVLLQVFNPNLYRLAMAAIGVKVWLFYIPLLYVSAAAVRIADDLIRLLRFIVLVSVVPCAVGLAQFALANLIGYEDAIRLFYGEAAMAATQGFGRFEFGATLYRIPSTFSFVAQYSGFTLAMIVPAYALGRLDANRTWRLVAHTMLLLAIVAGLLSGSRGNFLFIPMLLALIYVLDARVTGALAAIVLFPTLPLAVLWLTGLDPLTIFGATETLVGQYGTDLVLPNLLDSVQKYPMGLGTGMNTGPARYAMSEREVEHFVGYEGYYAKAVTELGIPGLLILLALFGALLFYGLRAHLSCRDPRLKSCSAALLAFLAIMMVHNFKGWQIDLDPINVYFWLFAGMLFKLPYLAPAAEPGRAAPAAGLFRRGAGNIRSSAGARPRA